MIFNNSNKIKINTNKIFLFAIFLFICIKLSLIMGNRMTVFFDANHDDMLMYSRAVSISNGKWLGPYNNLTLAKGAFFSIWLAFLHFLSIPMLIGNEILYISSCLFFIWCINNLILNKKVLFFVFSILLFNPVTLGDFSIIRIYRDGIYPALILFVFAGTIGMFLKKDDNNKLFICSSLSGIFLSAAWHTREETFWILPFIIAANIVIAIFIIAEKKYKENIKKYLLIIFPFIILFLSNLLISSLNYIKYGRSIINDSMSKDFQNAGGALTRVAHEKFDYYNLVPEEVRMKIYQVSPSFNELRPYLDEGSFDGWKNLAKNNYGWPLHDFYSWFMWALRDAVAACGYYDNPQKAKEYYERLAKEVNYACDTGILPSRTGKRVTSTPPFSKEYIIPTLRNIIKTTLFVINYNGVNYQKNNIYINNEQFVKVRNIEYYLNQLSSCQKYLFIINGWAFDSSGDVDIYITNSLNQKVDATILRTDSMDIYYYFNEKYKTAMKARFLVNLDIDTNMDYYLNINNNKNEQINLLIDNNLPGGLFSENISYYIDNVVSPNNQINSKFEKLKYLIINILLNIYKLFNPVITIIALLLLFLLTLLTLYRLINKKNIYYYKEVIILWGLLLTFFIRIIMIAYISASSFPAINVMYLSSCYPIMIIFNCISISCLFSHKNIIKNIKV